MRHGLVRFTKLTSFVAIVSVAVGSACRSDPIFSRMSDSTFVQAMVELRRLPVGAGVGEARGVRRDSILRKHDITAADLESTAVWLARDPQRAAEVWRAIESTAFTPP
jgi:hypothetical protein